MIKKKNKEEKKMKGKRKMIYGKKKLNLYHSGGDYKNDE